MRRRFFLVIDVMYFQHEKHRLNFIYSHFITSKVGQI